MGFQNFYNEPAAVSALARLGTTIPWPAFPNCMSTIMAVALGNPYGVAWGAQADVASLLNRLSENQWNYYLNECLPRDRLILQKLVWEKPRLKWIELLKKYELQKRNTKVASVKKLVDATLEGKGNVIQKRAEEILNAAP